MLLSWSLKEKVMLHASSHLPFFCCQPHHQACGGKGEGWGGVDGSPKFFLFAPSLLVLSHISIRSLCTATMYYSAPCFVHVILRFVICSPSQYQYEHTKMHFAHSKLSKSTQGKTSVILLRPVLAASVPPTPSCLSPLEDLVIRRLYGLLAVFKVKFYLWTAGERGDCPSSVSFFFRFIVGWIPAVVVLASDLVSF